MAVGDPPPKKTGPLFPTPAPVSTGDNAPQGSTQPAATTAPSDEWAAGGNLLPQSNQLAPGIQPGQSAQDFILQRLAQLGQGAEDIGHGIYNYTRSAGNYATGGGIDRALGLANQYLPAGTPAALRPNPYESQRGYTEQARAEMGLGLTNLSFAQGLRGYSRLAGPAAEAAVGQSFLNPALQMAGYGALKGGSETPTGEAPDWKKIALNATGYGLLGAGGGLVANRVVSPLIRWGATKYYGGSTPESIAETLNQTAANTEQQATAQTTEAQNALNEKLSNIKIPSGKLGFKIEGQTDPSVLETQGYRDWLESQGVKDPGAVRAPFKPSADANYTGHLYDEGNLGYSQWLKNQAIRNAAIYSPSTNLPTAQQRMMDSINQQLNAPEVAGPTSAAQAEADAVFAHAQRQAALAHATASQAEELASAGRRAGLPGQNVPGEFAAKLDQPGLTPAQIQAYSDIAKSGVPGKGPAMWQAIGRLLGGAGGATLGYQVGEPAVGTLLGQEAGGSLLSKFGGPTGAEATQAALARQWPQLTGEWPAASRGTAKAFNAISTLYGLK